MANSQICEALKAAICSKPPFCHGAISLPPADGYLFYKAGKDFEAKWLDLRNATEIQLESLSSACTPATFGLDKQDVLDESYRKAGKMDTGQFSTQFDVQKMRLVDRVRAQLLEGEDERKPISAELYKLNVYGKDSFFKSHKDTPRSNTMFGSLVVVFSTAHEGGNLILRHRGEEWVFDAAEVTRDADGPAIAYVAFYSDVDHEVTLVKSGYRVTLTYNLYFESEPPEALPPSVATVAPSETLLKEALFNALQDPSFLPKGGLLGFGLSFMYPIEVTPGHKPLRDLHSRLKGSDAVINRVCDQLSLTASLKAIYVDNVETEEGWVSHHVMVDEITSLDDMRMDEGIAYCLSYKPHNGKVIYDLGKSVPRDWRGPMDASQTAAVLWITPLTEYSHFDSPCVAYGNEPSVGHIYGDICLVVEVGSVGRRETKDSK